MQRNQVTGHSSPWSCGTQVARGLASAAVLALLIHGVAATAQIQSRIQSFSGHTLGAPLPGMPEAASPLTLRAVNDPVTGVASFSFAGNEVPPVLHTSPGHVLQVDYVNAMSTHSTETCVDGPCSNMTNLHFHGLHVSPASPQDDVISMMADPGQSLHYEVQIPADQPPGLYWYHTHPHGESYQQALDGMSGALIVDGIERYAPEVRSMRQQVLVLRDAVLKKGDRASTNEVSRVEASNDGCGSEPEAFGRLLTVNGALRPAIAIQPGEKQFWRVVNASPDLYVDLQLSGETMEIIALDGMPLAFHNPGRRAEIRAHVLLVYSATKAAVDAITVSLATELGPKHIRVNSINPGMVETEGLHSAGFAGGDFQKQIEQSTPLGRIAQPKDIATAAVFFASDDAAWVTGQTLILAGGARH